MDKLRIGGIRKVPCPAEVKGMLALDAAKMHSIKEQMLLQMKQGLQGSASPMLMLPTHLTKLPTGKETGSFLALDLGGTNFRVLKVTLLGKGKFKVACTKHKVDEKLMHGSGTDLFTFFAEKVKEMVPEAVGAGEGMPLGFTFSFPVQQTSINVGTLVRWTKGFTCAGVEGEDVVALLQAALKAQGMNVRVEALVNDTPGTMFAAAYSDPSVSAGLILGTGTNLCFAQKMNAAPKLHDKRAFNSLPSVATWRAPPYCDPHAQQIINTEWGGFGDGRADESLPQCSFDKALDAASLNPGEHLYEKMIGGMFLGELVRLVVADLVAQGKLFSNLKNLEAFCAPASGGPRFNTECMSKLEASKSYREAREVLSSLGVDGCSNSDIEALRAVCVAVSDRAAALAATGLAAVAVHLGRDLTCQLPVAVDGTLYAKYPNFKERMLCNLRMLLGKKMGVRFLPAQDGSGVGAALAAAAACSK